MPRGGDRPGAGRPKGSRSVTTTELAKWLEAIGGGTLEDKLGTIAEDVNVPTAVRLEALRRLFGLFAARIAKLAPNEEGISA